MTRVAVVFRHLGPYHYARLAAAARVLDVVLVELLAAEPTYGWDPVSSGDRLPRTTLFTAKGPPPSRAAMVRRTQLALDALAPAVVAIAGWWEPACLAAIKWCGRHGKPLVMMSESTVQDFPRSGWKEALKRRVVGTVGAALVGGSRQADYVARLGMPPQRTFTGYASVENAHFAGKAAEARRAAAKTAQRLGLRVPYFLSCARFIAKKNLKRLIESYAEYRRQAGAEPWPLVLVGDGELRPELERLRDALGLHESVHMPGRKQYDELPAYYALAGAFILASTSDQWGLVVNEAMAAGLPVLVSRRCGCAPDLVEEGRNGFTFDPEDVSGLARLMARMSSDGTDRAAMARVSETIIAGWTTERFAEALRSAVDKAIAVGPPRLGVLERGLFWALT